PAFDVADPAGTAVLRYEGDEPLLSGWLLGGAHLRGRAALVEVRLGRGRGGLLGLRPPDRAPSWVAYIPLPNRLFLPAPRRRPQRARISLTRSIGMASTVVPEPRIVVARKREFNTASSVASSAASKSGESASVGSCVTALSAVSPWW